MIAAGHEAEDGSEAARLLKRAEEGFACADHNEGIGWEGWACGDRQEAAKDIARAQRSRGYVGPAPTPTTKEG